MRAVWFLSLWAAWASAACASRDDGAADGGAPFIAFAPDFTGYESWESFDLGGGDAQASHDARSDAGDDAGCAPVHDPNAPRVAFLNERPAVGAAQFPVGTMLVKEIHRGSGPADWQTFAMVKRGGGFNPSGGCSGWEWFELGVTASPPTIIWRGAAPPAGEGYAACGVDCNGCHSAAQSNDCVLAPELALSALAK